MYQIAGYMNLGGVARLECQFPTLRMPVGGVRGLAATYDRAELRADGGGLERLKSCGNGIPHLEDGS
jgi:hypothetical protein